MDPAVCLYHLRQGNRAIEDYVQDFIELAYLTSWDKLCLMIFLGGLSDTQFMYATITLTGHYVDLALQLSGSVFTVGVVKEQRSTPTGAAAPEPRSIMAASPESLPKVAASSESLPKMATSSESLPKMAARSESFPKMATRS